MAQRSVSGTLVLGVRMPIAMMTTLKRIAKREGQKPSRVARDLLSHAMTTRVTENE
jgi:hypothetical protein